MVSEYSISLGYTNLGTFLEFGQDMEVRLEFGL